MIVLNKIYYKNTSILLSTSTRQSNSSIHDNNQITYEYDVLNIKINNKK